MCSETIPWGHHSTAATPSDTAVLERLPHQSREPDHSKGLWRFLTWPFVLAGIILSEQFFASGARAAQVNEGTEGTKHGADSPTTNELPGNAGSTAAASEVAAGETHEGKEAVSLANAAQSLDGAPQTSGFRAWDPKSKAVQTELGGSQSGSGDSSPSDIDLSGDAESGAGASEVATDVTGNGVSAVTDVATDLTGNAVSPVTDVATELTGNAVSTEADVANELTGSAVSTEADVATDLTGSAVSDNLENSFVGSGTVADPLVADPLDGALSQESGSAALNGDSLDDAGANPVDSGQGAELVVSDTLTPAALMPDAAELTSLHHAGDLPSGGTIAFPDLSSGNAQHSDDLFTGGGRYTDYSLALQSDTSTAVGGTSDTFGNIMAGNNAGSLSHGDLPEDIHSDSFLPPNEHGADLPM